MISSSVDWSSGSILNLRVPVNRTGSYGITVIRFLSSWIGTSAMSMPSSIILPENNSTILEIEMAMVLFPAPVLPTTPIFSPALTSKVRSCRTSSVVGLYLSWTFWNWIWPLSGQFCRCFSCFTADLVPLEFS